MNDKLKRHAVDALLCAIIGGVAFGMIAGVEFAAIGCLASAALYDLLSA